MKALFFFFLVCLILLAVLTIGETTTTTYHFKADAKDELSISVSPLSTKSEVRSIFSSRVQDVDILLTIVISGSLSDEEELSFENVEFQGNNIQLANQEFLDRSVKANRGLAIMPTISLKLPRYLSLGTNFTIQRCNPNCHLLTISGQLVPVVEVKFGSMFFWGLQSV